MISTTWLRVFGIVATLALVLATIDGGVRAQRAPSGDHWVGTWATAEVGRPQTPPVVIAAPAQGQPAAPPPAAPAPFMHFNNQTLRQIVRVSIGGNRLRVVLSNKYGTAPLTIAAAHVALRQSEAALVPQSDRVLLFSGRPSMAIPSGAIIYSDPVDLTLPAQADLAIDIYLPGDTNTPSPLTMHTGALQTSYVSQTGNHTGTPSFPVVATTTSWFLLSRVEVMGPEAVGAIVAFGDSITDGSRSTVDTNNRWPNHLARRLLAEPGMAKMAVLNAGIGGNRVLTEGAYNAGINAVARFDANVLGQAAATHVIVLEGINDIGNARQNPTPTAEDLIAGHRQLIERAHTHGLKIFGATLTPFEGAAYYTKEGESKRQALNQWIRTGRAYDGVVDFDLATRDPASPGRFLSQYDSGDHLHPNDAGYQAMGNAIDLSIFRPARASSGTTRQP
jgi:lysophospholipase L1-like esterase